MKVIAWDGNPISKPGIYSGVPISVYHSGRLCVGPSISSSGLRTIFSESEAHFWDKCPLNPDAEPMEETGSLVLGRATHHLLLGEANFVQEFALRPSTYSDDPKKPWSGNSKECKAWLADQRKAAKTVVTPEQMEKIKGMALRLGREPLVRAGALNGLIECTMAVLDEETGVWLLARPDVIPTDSGDYVDLKTTTSVLYPDLVRTLRASDDRSEPRAWAERPRHDQSRSWRPGEVGPRPCIRRRRRHARARPCRVQLSTADRVGAARQPARRSRGECRVPGAARHTEMTSSSS